MQFNFMRKNEMWTMRRLISQVWREQNKNTEINVHLIVNTSDNRRQKIWKNTKWQTDE